MKYFLNLVLLSVIVLITLGSVVFLSPKAVDAHPGGTDSNGCHHCWTNCAKWGLEYGEYHSAGGKSCVEKSTQTDTQSNSNKVDWVDWLEIGGVAAIIVYTIYSWNHKK